MEYLDEVVPDPAMVPRSPAGRAALRVWLRYFEEVATPAVRFPSFNQAFVRRFAAMSVEEFDAQVAARPIRRRFIEKMGQSRLCRQGHPDRVGEHRADLQPDGSGADRQANGCSATSAHRSPTAAWHRCSIAWTTSGMPIYGPTHRRYRPGSRAFANARLMASQTFYAGSRMSDLYDDLDKTRRTLPESGGLLKAQPA